jgi:hypothetical protein
MTDMAITGSTTPDLIDLPARDLLVVDGEGGPDEPGFDAAIRALYAVRTALGARDDVPLEGTYQQGDDPLRFDLARPDGWRWWLAVPAPAAATAGAVEAARGDTPVELRTAPAQRVARLVHVGPYAEEGPSLARLYAFVADAGLTPAGPHTEIYLNDPSTTPAAELRTVLQVPVT